MKINKKGFTLVELLVVIAIIGILSTVAVVNLNSARTKAKIATVHSSLSQLDKAIIFCFDDGNNILYDGTNSCGGGNTPIKDTLLCVGSSATWPDVSLNNLDFSYGTCVSNISSGKWGFPVTNTSGTTINCSWDKGCVIQ